MSELKSLNNEHRVVIVGAGLAGSLLALCLSQHGYPVDLYERRPDPRQSQADGRSINLGLSKRGIKALKSVGLLDEVLHRAVVMSGRVIHHLDGKTSFQAYGNKTSEVLHSIDRNELNQLLIDYAEKQENINLYFEHKLVGINKKSRHLLFETDGMTVTAQAVWTVGADGAFSTMRRELQRGERADFHQEFLEWGYKELTLEANPDGSSRIELTALHVWPRGHCLIVSHPNLDGSHTLTLFLPFEGEESFEGLQTEAEVKTFLTRYFPDLTPYMSDLLNQWFENPTGALITTRTNQWSFADWAVLVGDACHAQYPFYGQGMNSAFEDCCLLTAALLEHEGQLKAAFSAYEQQRRPHTDALGQLSKDNFIELRDTVKSPLFAVRKKIDLMLNKLFPNSWLPLYTMIAHSTMPYGEAKARAIRQQKVIYVAVAVLAIGIGTGLVFLLNKLLS